MKSVMKKRYFHKAMFHISCQTFRYRTTHPRKTVANTALYASETRLGSTAYESVMTMGKNAHRTISENRYR